MKETYHNEQEALKEAQDIADYQRQTLHVIYTYGKGYEIVTDAFKLNRSYYHDAHLGKMKFDLINTVKPANL